MTVPVGAEQVIAQVWRVDVGRVPLFLLDADRPENGAVARWITSRLYTGTRDLRLAQYALLGIGGMRALQAMGIDPAVVHLNEGHAAFASLELARSELAAGASLDDALAEARARTVFTTHTPVPAGNDTYAPELVASRWARSPTSSASTSTRSCGWGAPAPTTTASPSASPSSRCARAARATASAAATARSRARCGPPCGPIAPSTTCRSAT